MAALMHYLITLFIALFLSVSCAEKLKYYQEVPHASGGDLSDINPIPFADTPKSTFARDLKSNSGRPTLLLFSSTNCSSCNKEHEMIARYLDQRLPDLVNIFTLMVGARENSEMIWQWRERRGFTWPIGLDTKRELMKRFCDKNITPCTVIFDKNNKKIFSAQSAHLTIADLQEHTGPWFKSNPPPPPPPPTTDETNDDALADGKPNTDPDNPIVLFDKTFPAIYLSSPGQPFDLNLSQNKNKKTVLFFGVSGCGDCKIEHEELQPFAAELMKKANIYTVNIEMDLSADDFELGQWLDGAPLSPWPFLGMHAVELLTIFGDEYYFPAIQIYNEKNQLIYIKHTAKIDVEKLRKIL